ncbi:MAG: tetratricopeptide repeat protein [Alphaproteobacteria bacterium]
MSDIFREVDEDIRRDQLKKIWDRFGPYIIGAAVAIVLATAGFRGWEYWQTRQAENSGDRFVAAIEEAQAGNHDAAIAALEQMASKSSGAYPVLARFRLATERASLGDTTGAIGEYDAVATDRSVSSEIRNIARLRAAIMLVDSSTAEQLLERIGELAATGNPWRHTARELLGMAAWRNGDFEAARGYFDEISVDQETPNETRQRSQILLGLITARIGPPADGG